MILPFEQVRIGEKNEYPDGETLSQEAGVSLSILQDALCLSKPVKQEGIDPGNPYSKIHNHLELLRQYALAAPEIPPSLPPLSMTPHDLSDKIDHWQHKPTLLITGRFDSGKTRIANALLGSDNLPSQYTPTTSVVTFVRHVSDRPEWQREDVWIMKRGFNPARWNDLEHCRQFCLASGGYEALQKFGTKESEGEEIGAKAALVYMNSRGLRACTLIDVPGFQDDAEDGEMATNSASLADVLIYTSPAKGFLDASDFLHLGQLLRVLPPIDVPREGTRYSNFFLVATHADPSISDEQMQMILDKGSRRLYRHLGDSVFASATHQLSEGQLRERLFPFWFESPNRREALEKSLTHLLSRTLPAAIINRINDEVKDIKAKNRVNLGKQIESYEAALSEIEVARQKIAELRKALPLLRSEIERNKADVRTEIGTMRRATTSFIQNELARSIQAEHVESFIRKHFRKEDKNEAKKDAAAKLLEDVQARLETFVTKQSERLIPLINKYLNGYDVSSHGIEISHFARFEAIPFDAQGAFAGGLAAAGTLGALGLWASAMGNLGGYILVAKLASILSVAGLGVGSVGLVTLVAAIGGPVTVAVGIALILSLGIWSLFGEAWQSRLAKKLSKTLQEQSLLEKIERNAERFWDNTWNAFEQGATSVEDNFAMYLATNEALLKDGNSRQNIEAAISVLRNLTDFFGGIPWGTRVP